VVDRAPITAAAIGV